MRSPTLGLQVGKVAVVMWDRDCPDLTVRPSDLRRQGESGPSRDLLQCGGAVDLDPRGQVPVMYDAPRRRSELGVGDWTRDALESRPLPSGC